MSFFKTFGGVVVRPYREIGKGLNRVAGSLRNAGRVSAGADAIKEGEGWLDVAPDASAAFETLYQANRWTPEDLAKQYKAVYRSKWVAILLTVLTFIASIAYGLVSSLPYYITIIVIVLCLAFSALAGARAYLLAVYQAQLDLRMLLSSRQFLERSDMIRRIFS